MMTVTFLLLISAFVATIVSAMGKCPLWVAVLLVTISLLLQHVPLK